MRRNSSKLPIILGAAVVVIAAVILISVLAVPRSHASVEEGLNVLHAMESQNVGDVQAIIAGTSESLEYTAEDNSIDWDAIDERNYRQTFSDSVIFGDSITHSLLEVGYLDTSCVVGEIGLHLLKAEDYLQTAAALSPKHLFIYMGYNDAELYGDDGNLSGYEDAYREFLDKLRELMPDVDLYLNSILPVNAENTYAPEWLYDMDQYNRIIEKLAPEYNATYLDNTALAQKRYYEEDGIHMHYNWYPIWLDHMAEAAGL